jgi:hypothetical protein
VARAHFIIRTDGSYAETDLAIRRVYESLNSGA